MSRMSELAADLPPDDGNAAITFDVGAALTRIARGTSTVADAQALAYLLNIAPDDSSDPPEANQ